MNNAFEKLSLSPDGVSSSVGSTAAESPVKEMMIENFANDKNPNEKIIAPGKCALYPELSAGCDNEQFGANGAKYWSVKWMGAGSGFGCVAEVDIPKGTLIHTELPIISHEALATAIEKHDNGEHRCHEDDDAYLRETVKVTEAARKKIWLMHDNFVECYKDPHNKNDKKRRLWGIIASNAFENHDKGQKACLYFLTAKFNHSCSPNIRYTYKEWEHQVFTIKDVKKGEELFDCYNDVFCSFEPKSLRQKFFLNKYKFQCCCPECEPLTSEERNTLKDEEQKKRIILERVKKSDKRRKKVKNLAETISENLGIELYPDEVPGKFDVGTKDDWKTLHAVHNYEEDDSSQSIGKTSASTAKINSKNANSQKSKTYEPKLSDLDLLVEYIDLVKNDKTDDDLWEAYETAYDLAVFLGKDEYLRQYKFGEKVLELYEQYLPDDKRTRKFKAKLQRQAMFG